MNANINQFKKKNIFEFPNWLKCDECDYKSSQTEDLTQHRSIQYGLVHLEKWFTCDECTIHRHITSGPKSDLNVINVIINRIRKKVQNKK